MWRGRLLAQATEQLTQALQDYDEVERELRAWISPEPGLSPNPNLLAMNHEDLAILADQYRIKYLQLMKGGTHGTT